MADYTWAAPVDNVQTTISDTMTNSSPGNGGTLNIASSTNAPANGYALIDSEIIKYSSVGTNTIVLAAAGARGSGNPVTTAAAHSIGTAIKFSVIPSYFFSELRAQSPTTLMTEQGDVLYASAANTPAGLHHATAGDVLASGGHGANPAWATPPSRQDYVTDTDGATVTFDLSTGLWHKVVLGGNRTLALSNVVAGMKFVLKLIQDGTGTRTVTWFTTISWVGGSAPTLTTTINKSDLFGFVATAANTFEGFVVGQNV